MKRMIIFLTLVAICSSAYPATALIPATSIKPPMTADEVYLPVGNTARLISLLDLSRISVKDFEILSGQKMKFIEKVNFKIAQRELLKSINQDGTFKKKNIEKYLKIRTGPGGGF